MTNRDAWNFAIGVTRMAGLEPTPEFMEQIEKEINGTATMDELKAFLDKKYKKKNTNNLYHR